MKTLQLSLLISLLIISLSASAQADQSDMPYKSLESFSNDTIAYLEYNFNERPPESYAGMTVQQLMDTIQVPVVEVGIHAIMSLSGTCDYYRLYVVNETDRYTVDGYQAKLYVAFRLEKALTRDELTYERSNLREYLKDRIIKSADMDISIYLYKERMESRKKIEKGQELVDVWNKDFYDSLKKGKDSIQ